MGEDRDETARRERLERDIRAMNRAAEALRAEQPSTPPAEEGYETVDAVLAAFGHHRAEQPSSEFERLQAMRQMTPNEIRAAELSNLLAWIEGPDEMSIGEIATGIRFRIGELLPDKAPSAEQPSPLARISGAIASEVRELPGFEARMEFLTGLIEAISKTVAEETGADVVGWERRPVAQASVDGMLDDVERRLIIPTAIEFLGKHGDDVSGDVRVELATVVAARLIERLGNEGVLSEPG